MEEKLSLLAELIKLARCDNKLSEQEYLFLWSVAQSLHIDKPEFEKLFNADIDLKAPVSEFDRILQFHRLVLLMNIDKISSDKEIRFLKDIAIRLGLNPMATNQVLRTMNEYPNKVIPADRLISIFKEHYN